MTSIRSVLEEKKGVAEALGIITILLVVITGVGIAVSHYAMHSKKAQQQTALTQEITNRAEAYASILNEDLVNVQVPSLERECSSTTEICTQIVSVTPGADGDSTVLRIQGDTVSLLGDTLTRDVTLVAIDVTHITGIDEAGHNTWGLAEEGVRFKTWGVASGKPSDVEPADMSTNLTWMTMADRAGIDSNGDLWVWGRNDVGQAGSGSATAQPISPVKIDAGDTKFRWVATIEDRGYAIDSHGFAWAWGKNGAGELGLPGAVVMKPTKMGLRANKIVAGNQNTIILSTAGEIKVIGARQSGFPEASADGVYFAGTRFKDIAANGAQNVVALVDEAGIMSVYGGSMVFKPSTIQYASVSLGSTAGYGISVDGKLYSFGTGAFGQLGQGTPNQQQVQTELMPGTKFVSVSAGRFSMFAVDATGRLFYTGRTAFNDVVDGALPQVRVLTQLLPEYSFRRVIGDPTTTSVAFIDTKGKLYGLGNAKPGLWPINYQGSPNLPVRMPEPDGFSS